ncbi:MAG: dihydrodipicolinate synthase [Erythrobacter sp.]|nr:dihydrodipicolinate synthase [Erythrobacter sp.]NCQ62942.1 dihydrodipicolinate synthase [Alphaproteobacteria bacterium]
MRISRRNALSGALAGAGTGAAALMAPSIARAQALCADRISPRVDSHQRAWANANLRGLMNLFLPTFREDGQTLDEDAIRHDVRHAIAQGFSGTLPMINWTLPGDPRWAEFHRILIDEAGDDLAVHGILASGKVESDLRLLGALEDMGVKLVLLASTYPAESSAEQLYDLMARRITATPLPVMLYAATGRRAFPSLGPAGQPLDVYDRIADLEDVVGVKISQPVSLTSTMQLCQRLGNRLSMGPVNLDFLPLLARHFDIAWSGQWNAEAVQTPAQPIGNRLLAASAGGDMPEVDTLARQIEPALSHFFALQAPVIRAGGHPWQHNRYYQWLSGGNGGLLPRDSHAPEGAIPVLDAKARTAMRAAYRASGLEPTDAPEEQFVVGRAAWARGVRAADLTELPYYSQD